MAESMEMGKVDKIGGRFQVDPVALREKRTSIASQSQSQQLGNNDSDDDTYPEETSKIIARRSSRLSSIKASFRDADHLPTTQRRLSKRGSMQTTRFQVTGPEYASDEDEGHDLLDGNGSGGDYDTKIYKSLRHFTREALPRLDNYRNIMSIQAQYRPTLDELHNATLSSKDQDGMQREADVEAAASGKGQFKMGWMQGVLMRCLLNIWGVMLFLRLSWVVAQAGVGQGICLIMTTTAVTTITALSMSAISTNGMIKGGGTYYMISRSLGPEFGGSIGMIFSLANAVACAMYVVGFCESMQALLTSFGVQIIDGSTHDIRVIGCITIIILLCIVVVGMEWEAKAQFGLLIMLVVAIIDFMIGTVVGPKSTTELAQGFMGYNLTLFSENFKPDYRVDDQGVHHDFFSVFSIFFPAATGILAGANVSGDLKDPQKAIPKGTLLAIVITTASYVIMAILVGMTIARDATGNLADAVNGSLAFLDCAPGECKFGMQNSFQVIELASLFGPFIYAGCFAATLSSALASLVSAPKVFQALCKDKLFPKIEWFARGYGKNMEPVRGYILTFFIAVAVILVGELNLIAPLISNFFLAAYALINFSTFHASLAKSLGWRPTFKYFNMWLSLIGAILCVFVMFLISWATALLTFACIIALYLIVAYRKPDVNWGSSTQAQTYKSALLSVQQLNNVEDHVKNYRPQILVLSGFPNSRPILVDFAYSLTKNVSLLLCGHVVRGATNHKHQCYLQRRAREFFQAHKLKAFYSYVDEENFESGCKSLMQASGIGKLRPNIVLMGFKNDWRTCGTDDLEMYFNVVHKAFDMYYSVGILRFQKGLDYSKVLGDDTPRPYLDVPRSIVPNDSSADLKIHGSLDSISHNDSQEDAPNIMNESNDSPPREEKKMRDKASSTSDLSSVAGGPLLGTTAQVSMSPDTEQTKTTNSYQFNGNVNGKKASKKARDESEELYKGPGGAPLPAEILDELGTFSKKHTKAVIDVWWLYDDGGLTLLLPYIISTRRNFGACKLRVFALTNKMAELEFEQRSMASLLAKFRIDYSDLKLLPDVTKKPKEESVKFFDSLIKDFKSDNPDEESAPGMITESELISVQDKTNRYLRIREHLREHSSKSDLVVMTLPMPRKNIVSAPLYMAWLDCLSQGMPPFLFVRGNQTSVLTFYS